MLILTRRIGQSLIIGEDVEVIVLGYRAGQIKLGIAAPKSVRVDRKEIRNRKDTELEVQS